VLRARLPEMERELVLGLAGELNACNLLRFEPSEPTLVFSGGSPLQLTALGQRFIAFVEGEVPGSV